MRSASGCLSEVAEGGVRFTDAVADQFVADARSDGFQAILGNDVAGGVEVHPVDAVGLS
jgi:hypothetical protein